MSSKQPQSSLFQVYLRLRPPFVQHDENERFLTVEPPETSQDDGEIVAPVPTHITLQPPSDSRKRAIERFGFTKVFEENASQLDVFHDTGMESLVRGVLKENRDGLVATLGVTGSGKSHTILGSKSQRGLTQMALDVIFRSLEPTVKTEDGSISPMMLASLSASDASEAQLFSAQIFLEAVYGDPNGGRNSRAATPMSPGRANTPLTVRIPHSLNSPQRSPRTRPPTPGTGPPRLQIYTGSPQKAAPLPSPIRKDRSGHGQQSTEQLGRINPGPFNPIPFTRSSPNESRLAKSRLYVFQEPTPALVFPRRQQRERPIAAPRMPDVSHLAVDLNENSDYVVLVSMYEVYNDRIFDLLTPSIVPGQGSAMSRGNNQQKDRRRPLLFKPTEGSPDRKLVAGLRKIACSSYEEALAILDVGLTERKVTGTGANSVSSRSHGFFCLEVKKMTHGKRYGEANWVGNTLTVVDLAGSERARTAKTAGATLAEAGKINESLMYLGQCLQMQSNLQDGIKTALVPFRQCKLTELLFSNSFPSSNQMSRGLHPQKAIMVVTADPLGDFNATSQILRYSALAREVTVPRVPSVTESILSAVSGKDRSASGCTSPNFAQAEELERAAMEITRLTKDCHGLAVRLAEEEIMRSEVEIRLSVAEDRCVMIEQEVREECWAEMDEMMEEERKRWQKAWDEQSGRNDEHIDKKIELVSRGFNIFEDPEPTSDQRMEELERENEQLRRRLATLEREMSSHSPTRKPRSKNPASSNLLGRESDIENALQRMNQLNLTDSMFTPASPSSSPSKNPRKLPTRKFDLAPESEI
ncbi:uncharacterized protein N7443_010446 [Penicillium atrosanguineum]|uniref:Kinesin motor domain-containing protein n=1 Tax=Penicillium atrosanguineum TaxID=1132637 RepID=A0A9W9U1X6_9EURO|nr:uncharacterized protein N7443_010446 [Penicillium atrosanguineum]KAJ5290193.1 hypothetical protein N7443_010446 [Penicillium atrosanguineum]KAJ5308017.1 hypothetical protein N7476_008673 [Penicillium atrosanguineum]